MTIDLFLSFTYSFCSIRIIFKKTAIFVIVEYWAKSSLFYFFFNLQNTSMY